MARIWGGGALGFLIAVVAPMALLVSVAHAAWSESGSENMRTLSFDEGLITIAILGFPSFLLILGACFLIASPSRADPPRPRCCSPRGDHRLRRLRPHQLQPGGDE